jgi:hypothetical protein
LRNIRSLYIKEFSAEVDNGKVTNYRIKQRSHLIWSASNNLGEREPNKRS